MNTIQNCFANQKIETELYLEKEDFNTYHPYGMFNDRAVLKEFEIVLDSNPKDSYFQSKGTYHKQNKFSEL